MKIRNKLLTIYLAVSIIPLAFLGALSYNLARETMVKETLANLDGIASRLSGTLEDLADRDVVTAATLSNEVIVKNSVGLTSDTAAARAAFVLPETLKDLQRIDPNLRNLMVLDLEGKVVAATDAARVGEAHAGTDFFELGKTAATGNLYFKNAAGDVLLNLSAPVFDNGTLAGVVVDEHYPKIVLQLFSDAVGLGETGEVMLVKKEANGDAVFVTPTRFDPQAAMVRKISHDDPHSAMMRAFNGAPGAYTDVVDYRGKDIYASSRYVDALQLGVEAKMDRTEAVAPLRDIAFGMLSVILLAALFILAITISVAKAVAGPIVNLTNITEQISLGKLELKFDEIESNDEVGDLYRSFERILVSLKLAMRETNKGVEKVVEKKDL